MLSCAPTASMDACASGVVASSNRQRRTPAPDRGHDGVGLRRAPTTRFIELDGVARLQCRVDNLPRGFDRIFSRKQGAVTANGVADKPFVRIHHLALLVAAVEFDAVPDQRRAR